MNGQRCIKCRLPMVVLEQQVALRKVKHLTKSVEQTALVEALRKNTTEIQAQLAGVVVAAFFIAAGRVDR